MAKRFTDTDLWDKEWYMRLSLKQKCLLKLVRDKCDLCGVWSPNWIIACAYIGEAVNETDLLEIDGGKQFKKLPSGKIYCIGFIEFQYGNLSDRSPVHKKIIGLLEQNGLLDNYKEIPIKYPIDRVQEEEEDKEEEKEEAKERITAKGFFLSELPKDLALTEIQTGATIEFIRLQTKKILSDVDIGEEWEAFKIDNFGKKEWKPPFEDVLSHFRRTIRSKFKNGSNNQISGSTKLGTSEAKIAKLKALD